MPTPTRKDLDLWPFFLRLHSSGRGGRTLRIHCPCGTKSRARGLRRLALCGHINAGTLIVSGGDLGKFVRRFNLPDRLVAAFAAYSAEIARRGAVEEAAAAVRAAWIGEIRNILGSSAAPERLERVRDRE